jgi:hypothetical protein
MINKTKRYKGGNKDELLNDNFIISRLKEIINQRPLKYKFNIDMKRKYQNKVYIVYIENEDNEIKYCLEIGFLKQEKGVSILVYSLNKCAPIQNYGNFILSCLKEFADTYGYYSVIIISDASTLDLSFHYMNEDKLVYIDLAYLNILSRGESWYNRMGFYNEKNREEIETNKTVINQEFDSLDDATHIIDYIEDGLKMYRNKTELIPICLKLINSYGRFREIYHFILDITKMTGDDKIRDVFSSLTDYIKSNCDTNAGTCRVDYLTIQKISCFIDFVFEFLDLQYKNRNLEYIAKKYKAGKKYNAGKKLIKTKKRIIKKGITRKNKTYI